MRYRLDWAGQPAALDCHFTSSLFYYVCGIGIVCRPVLYEVNHVQ
jgi:hypothetical protein